MSEPIPPSGLSGVYVETAANTFDYEEDWQEAGDGLHQPGGGVTAGSTTQEATLCGYIPWGKERSAMRYFLGFAWADAGPPYALHREPPAPHPQYPQLRATGFSASGFVIKANTQNEADEPYVETPFADQDGDPLYTTGYQLSLCTVKYKTWGRMRFLPDEDVGDYTDEYKRWVTYSLAPQIQTLEVDGSSQLAFAEGEPLTAGTGGAAVAFPVPLPELMAKADLSVKWWAVPHAYISSDPDIPKLDKILPRLGTLNKDTFLGYRPGELLLKAVRVDEMVFPVTASDPTDVPCTGYDLTMIWEFFSPPKGVPPGDPVPDNIPAPTPPYGHRLYPWRKNGGWYIALREDDAHELLAMTDHFAVFSHALDPATSLTPVPPTDP